MQIIHLALLRTSSPGDAVVLSQCSDLAQFGFFERPTVRQMLQFFAKTVCGRVSPGQRVSVDQEEMEGYRVHAHVRADGLAATATGDAEYPARAAFSLLAQALAEFERASPGWRTGLERDWPPLAEHLRRARDPKAYDRIAKIQGDLDETTDVLHKTIDNLLERGEKLDSLVERSDDLSKQSKMFYKQARKTNSCCVVS